MSNGLTIEEAAELVRVSKETIRYWVKTGRIKPVYAIEASKRTGRPWGIRIPRDQLLEASPIHRERRLKETHPEKLLTIRDIAAELKIKKDLAYRLVRRFNLDKVRIDGWTFAVSGDQLYNHLLEDPYYWVLLHNTPEFNHLTN